MSVNPHKMRNVLDFIRRQGKLPTDQHGQLLGVRDLIVWFKLEECLSREELAYIKNELYGLIDAEKSLEKLKQLHQVR